MLSGFRKWTLVIQIWVMTENNQAKGHSYSLICRNFSQNQNIKSEDFKKALNALVENDQYMKTWLQSIKIRRKLNRKQVMK